MNLARHDGFLAHGFVGRRRRTLASEKHQARENSQRFAETRDVHGFYNRASSNPGFADVPLSFERRVLLANTLGVQAVAEHFATFDTIETLGDLWARARAQKRPFLVLGEGSNVILPAHWDGVVVSSAAHSMRVVSENREGCVVEAGAGVHWHRFVTWCAAHGAHGLENLAFIPGTVGAAPVQNIGAYGVEVGRFIRRVRCFDTRKGCAVTLDRATCCFGYRTSVFKTQVGRHLLVCGVEFDLTKRFDPCLSYTGLEGFGTSPATLMARVGRLRRARLPSVGRVPNAGSFFINPVLDEEEAAPLVRVLSERAMWPDAPERIKVSAAALLEASGCRGMEDEENGLRMSARHALVLENPRRADQEAILAFAEKIRQRVRARF